MSILNNTADHRRTNLKTPYRRGAYWLAKRRDGRSPVWMVAWYDGAARTIRYRSTRSMELDVAKAALDDHAETTPAPRGASQQRTPARFVYFIGGDTGAIKIGSASDPTARLVTLQCGSPIGLRILATCAGGQRKEIAYHRLFAAARTHGEWFERTPEIEAEIALLQGEGS